MSPFFLNSTDSNGFYSSKQNESSIEFKDHKPKFTFIEFESDPFKINLFDQTLHYER